MVTRMSRILLTIVAVGYEISRLLHVCVQIAVTSCTGPANAIQMNCFETVPKHNGIPRHAQEQQTNEMNTEREKKKQLILF